MTSKFKDILKDMGEEAKVTLTRIEVITIIRALEVKGVVSHNNLYFSTPNNGTVAREDAHIYELGEVAFRLGGIAKFETV